MMKRAFSLFFYLLVKSSALPGGVSVTLGDKVYWIHENPEPGPAINATERLEPCTVMNIDGDKVTPSDLDAILGRFEKVDDVWSMNFAQTVIVQSVEHVLEATRVQLEEHFNDLGVTTVYFHQSLPTIPKLAEGPFFLDDGRLHAAYRLYPDSENAFSVSTIQDGVPFRYKSLELSVWGTSHPSTLTIAVPSRLKFTKTVEKPFAGDRLALKDTIDLWGLKTGAGSRAYSELYSTKAHNAAVVQDLLNLGFVVIGKTKTTQFADSEWATVDWVDYHAPWNPRGDGYQVPSASSAGSAAAVAAYDWLDYSVGTDTLGSIRAPASAQGIFAIRPSHGVASLEGIVPYSSLYDTVGVHTRDAKSLAKICKVLYPPKEASTQNYLPKRILYPSDYWPVKDLQSQVVFDSLITKLEAYLGVERKVISLANLWKETAPGNTNLSLTEFFDTTFTKSAHLEQRTFFKGIIQDWKSIHNGAHPIFNPQIRYKVNEFLPTLTTEVHIAGVQEKQIFKDWFEELVISPAENGYSDTIMLFPWSKGEPDYRDLYRQPQRFNGSGFYSYNWATYAETPEIIVPAGQTPFRSKVTEKIEYLPASIGIISGKGSDAMLAELLEGFLDSIGMGKGVSVGSVTFPELRSTDKSDGHEFSGQDVLA